MYTAISGLKNHQALLDVTGNNIANVNTYGFKSSRVAFKDLLSQTMSGASAPTAILGGTNARQVGLGMQIDSIQQIHTQGNIETTGNPTDLAINGDGYFEVTPDISGLSAAPPTAPPTVYQRAGNFMFDKNGDLVTSDGYHVLGYDPAPAATPPNSAPNLATTKVLNCPPADLAGPPVMFGTRSVSIDQQGLVTRIDSQGTITKVGWIRMAKFPNPSGLVAVGANKWSASNNSGTPVDGYATDKNGIGQLTPGALEMSNVDLTGVHRDDPRAAWLPGQQPRDHDE